MSRGEGYAGSALLYHPINDLPNFELFDQPFRTACCGEDGTADNCDLFFERRTINSPLNYVPPLLGKYFMRVAQRNSAALNDCDGSSTV